MTSSCVNGLFWFIFLFKDSKANDDHKSNSEFISVERILSFIFILMSCPFRKTSFFAAGGLCWFLSVLVQIDRLTLQKKEQKEDEESEEITEESPKQPTEETSTDVMARLTKFIYNYQGKELDRLVRESESVVVSGG